MGNYGGTLTWKLGCGLNEYSEDIVYEKKPICTAEGIIEKTVCAICGETVSGRESVLALGHDLIHHEAKAATAMEVGWNAYDTCSRCDYTTYVEIPMLGNAVNVSGQGISNGTRVYVDGVAYTVQNGIISLPDNSARSIVTYSYNTSDNSDPHKVYPTGMKVWMLTYSNGAYSIRRVSSLDNILQYAGSSIRITGKKGIRMITGVPSGMRSSLTGSGVEGYTLLEYGTCLEFDSALNGKDLTLNTTKKSNYAYKKGTADPIFKNTGSQIQYTNVLVGFSNEQCKDDISMRSYVKLQSPAGETVTLYGGTIHRSIGYIAYQNRNAFSPGTEAYKFIWDIIHAVYGNQYDSEYKG